MDRPLHVLIFGRNGQVGSALVRQLANVENCRVSSTDVDELDLTDQDATRQLVLDTAPDWVINTSAHTAVDRAEEEQELAHALNAVAPKVIAEACAACGAAMVHYSTDYVFSGSGTTPYLESDQPDPQSVYGVTKLAGEIAVRNALPRSIIFRTAWVYSPHGKNFVNTMLSLAETRDSLRVVGDQFGSPTLADDLAAATISAMQQIHVSELADTSAAIDLRFDLYHATGSGVTNWAEFSRAIMAQSGNQQVTVEAITTAEYPTPAPRPAYSVLDNSKLQQQFGITLPDWHDALQRCLAAR